MKKIMPKIYFCGVSQEIWVEDMFLKGVRWNCMVFKHFKYFFINHSIVMVTDEFHFERFFHFFWNYPKLYNSFETKFSIVSYLF